jgi:hypothetical protein
MKLRKLKFLAAGVLGAMALHPASLFACAACYGASDSPMAKGMNWGIFSLLGVVTMVLGSVATFFVFIGKRAAAAANEQPGADSTAKTDSTDKTEPTQNS